MSVAKNNETNIDLGEVPVGAKHVFAVRITNDTLGNYAITDSKSSCGCIVGVPNERLIKPGGESLMLVDFTPAAKGGFRQRVALEGTAGDAPANLYISIVGRCKPLFTIAPTSFTASGTEVLDIAVARNFDSHYLNDVEFQAVGDIVEKAAFADDANFQIQLKDWEWAEGELSRTISLRAVKGDVVIQEDVVVVKNESGLSIRPSVAIGVPDIAGKRLFRFYMTGHKSVIDAIARPGDLTLVFPVGGRRGEVAVAPRAIKRLSPLSSIVEVVIDVGSFPTDTGHLDVEWESKGLRKMLGSARLLNEGT